MICHACRAAGVRLTDGLGELFIAARFAIGVALVISLSLAATVVLAKLVGCMLPIAAKQLHMDPAIMASPLITTIVDAGAVLIYFQAAAALLRLPV